MNTPATIGAERLRRFDFQNNKVQIMDLPTLKRTQKEDLVAGVPLREMYHFAAIERAMALCRKYGLDYEVEEIFAAQNNTRQYPGVPVLKDLEGQYGEKAVEAHLLRRVFTTIRIDNHQTDELTTTLVLAYHQEGMQAAIGPCVKACHNQCIMYPERVAYTYGRNKTTVDGLFDTIDGWLAGFHSDLSADRARIERLKQTPVSHREILSYIGILASMRAAHDSSCKRLRDQVATYPLNSAQVNRFTEDILKKMMEKPTLTAWDVYNTATEYYKPDEYEIPTLISQNLAFTESLVDFIEGRPFFREVEEAEAVVLD